ncbi:hypothetical protein NIES267_07900 [Calothrix parasitica NIES-267]|uniref:Sulfatase-modifying factor enzyme-like domain-containing protein n=1 Tax=Calothrix parasitica NIES-267 TaxID=1973488 RepID=A0A1Z4LJD8_9CYAN|nr:hypothetical protein NIES267_07900 [Calothrix parasitica NIES-267]
MSDNQNPKPYDAVLGGQDIPKDAAVLGGIQGVKRKLNNSNPQIRIVAVEQALNYGKSGIDLIIKALKDESPLVQAKAYYLLIYFSEQKIKQNILEIEQALNHGERGLDLIIEALDSEFSQVQAKAYSLLVNRNEIKIKKALQEFQPIGLKLEIIEAVSVNSSGEIIQSQQHLIKSFGENLDKILQRQLYQKQLPQQYFLKEFGNYKTLEMVYIKGGTFMMGSPKAENNRESHERPQHLVTVKPFFLGKYPVTQAQWRAVALLPKVYRELNPKPCDFTGKNRPVYHVTWYEAVEFCSRLSKATGKKYGLPSETEWEYACRAGTTTPQRGSSVAPGGNPHDRADSPFHYGETITGELANYGAIRTYADEPKGEYREKTIPVGQFPPNAFGLYDMHGNVWEWCQDNWHDNYVGAPTDGSSWITKPWNVIFGSPFTRVVRSGSWFGLPHWCCCAQRFSHDNEFNLIPSFTDDRHHIKSELGFRIACDIF